MKRLSRWSVVLVLGTGLAAAAALADGNAGTTQPGNTNSVEPASPGFARSVDLLDNLYLDASAGWEKPTGERSTAFGLVGFNWGMPLNQPDPSSVALGLQAGGNVKARRDDPEWNGTFGGFARNFRTFHDQQGAFAALLDYRRTAFHNDLWAFRPVIGTTITTQDALGLEAEARLNDDHDQEMINQFNVFWTRDWTEQLGSELGLGYQWSDVNETLLRGRLAYGLTPNLDVGAGGDLNTEGNYAVGIAVSYHFGGTGRHAWLHNIGGSGKGLYTPFPDADFPELLHRTGR